jgi:hypothetical protein
MSLRRKLFARGVSLGEQEEGVEGWLGGRTNGLLLSPSEYIGGSD